MRLKRSIEKYIVHSWNVFSENLILFVPVLGVGFVSLMVYACLGAVLFFACIRDFIAMGYDFHDPYNLPWQSIGGYFSNFIFYIVAVFTIGFAFSIAVSIIHRAGIGYMFSQSVKKGRTNIGEYFEGVARYSGRMLNMSIIRGSILLIPIMLLLLFAIIVAKFGNGNSGGFAVLFIFGIFGVMIFEFIAMFMMWMWMPAVFIKDSSVMEGLAECLSFMTPRISNMLLFGVMWVIVTSMVSGFFELFITMFNALSKGGHPSTGALAGMMVFMLTTVRWFIITVMRVFFSVFYYKFYHDETSPDVQYEIPRPVYPQQPVYYGQRNLSGPLPQQYNVMYPPQPQYPGYPQQPAPPQRLEPERQPAQDESNLNQESSGSPLVEHGVDDMPVPDGGADEIKPDDANVENKVPDGDDEQLPPGFC